MTAHVHAAPSSGTGSLNRLAAVATLHCLTGCAIGEVLGMVIGTALGWSNAATIALAVLLAFVFGYSLTMLPLVRAGLAVATALPIAFAADSFSIAVMELVDNAVMLAVPGAMDAPLTNPLFWGALALAFAIAYVVAFPVNRSLIARGRGHAVVHRYHARDAASNDAGAPHGVDGDDDGHTHHGHHAHRSHDRGPSPAPASTASPRRLVAVGVTAMAMTIGIAAGGALLLESGAHGDEESSTGGGGTGGHSDGGGASTGLSGLAVARDGYRLVVEDTELVAGQRTPFRFSVVARGSAVRQFDEEGGVRMHVIIVRRDLTGYQHLHPTAERDGSWRAELTLPSGGVYRAYADFERNGEKTVLATDLFVAGDFRPAPLPKAAESIRLGGYRVELGSDATAGDETSLTYRITRKGVPVDVEPYLGAAGHLVALREGDLAYLHVHPLEERRGEVRFAATFPTAGRYRLFLQFKDTGRVRTAPLTVRVAKR